MRYQWPGNIRELENAIERAMLLAEGSHIAVDDLRLGDFGTSGTPREGASVVKIPPTGIPLEEVERIALIEALKMSNWVQKDAAELLVDQPARHELQDQDARHRLPARPPRGAAASRAQRAHCLKYKVQRSKGKCTSNFRTYLPTLTFNLSTFSISSIFLMVLQFRLVAGAPSFFSTKLFGKP